MLPFRYRRRAAGTSRVFPPRWIAPYGSFGALHREGKEHTQRDPWANALLITIGISLAMVGPGAWSLDGCLFGWKRIEVGDGRAETSMRTITLEEHYVTPGFLESPGRSFMESATSARSRTANLLEQS